MRDPPPGGGGGMVAWYGCGGWWCVDVVACVLSSPHVGGNGPRLLRLLGLVVLILVLSRQVLPGLRFRFAVLQPGLAALPLTSGATLCRGFLRHRWLLGL